MRPLAVLHDPAEEEEEERDGEDPEPDDPLLRAAVHGAAAGRVQPADPHDAEEGEGREEDPGDRNPVRGEPDRTGPVGPVAAQQVLCPAEDEQFRTLDVDLQEADVTGGIDDVVQPVARDGEFPAVTLQLSKQPGVNAADIADAAIARIDSLKNAVIPEGVEVTVTRNYGATATEKAQKLIGKLAFATAFVVLLVFFALGRREALIVGVAVTLTLAATLFSSGPDAASSALQCSARKARTSSRNRSYSAL